MYTYVYICIHMYTFTHIHVQIYLEHQNRFVQTGLDARLCKSNSRSVGFWEPRPTVPSCLGKRNFNGSVSHQTLVC